MKCHICNIDLKQQGCKHFKKESNTSTKAQYIAHTKRYLKAELKEIEAALYKKLEKAEKSGAIPEHWMETGNHLLSKAIINSFCLDLPYEMIDKTWRKEAKQLHLFL
jgi:hypothetical protein